MVDRVVSVGGGSCSVNHRTYNVRITVAEKCDKSDLLTGFHSLGSYSTAP
jgi:hypothetical protein